MNKLSVYILLVILLIITFGCSKIEDEIPEAQHKEMYLSQLESELPYCSDLTILCEETYKDMSILVIGYSHQDKHFVDYRLAKWQGNHLELLGGGGGIAKYDDKVPLSFSSGWQIPVEEKESFLITYGEIYDNAVKSIKLTYLDDFTISKDITGNGYIFIRGEYVGAIKSMEVYDNNSEIIYHIP